MIMLAIVLKTEKKKYFAYAFVATGNKTPRMGFIHDQ